MKKILAIGLLCIATTVFAEQHNSMRVVLPSRDFSTYSKFLHTFGFHTLDSLSDICRLTDGQIFTTLMKTDEPEKVFLALFTDHINDIEAKLSWMKDVNVFRNNDSSITEIDVKAPGGVMLFLHPSSQTIREPERIPNKRCGAFIEFSVSVPNVDSAANFWKLFGFDITYKGNDPLPLVRVSDGEFTIGLHQDPYTEPGLQYGSEEAIGQIAAIRKSGIEPITTMQNKKGDTVTASFQAPEGLIINIFRIHE
jgi:hypothetical protein